MLFQSGIYLSDSELIKNSLEENNSAENKNDKYIQDKIKHLNELAIDLYNEQKFVESLNLLKEVEKIYLVINIILNYLLLT